MSYQDSHKRFDRLIITLLTGKDVEMSEITDIKAMLKESELREEFLNSLYDYAPCERLPMQSYSILMDLLRVTLQRSNDSDEYSEIMKIFTVSNLYAMKQDGITICLKCALTNHEAWRNPSFWLYCINILLARDVQRWAKYADYSSISFDFLSVDENEMNTILAINRIQAVLTSMRSVGVDEDVKEEFIRGTLESFGLSSAGVNILRPPTEKFIAWLLDVALLHREVSLLQTEKDFLTDLDKRLKSTEVGYCPLQEVLFMVAERLMDSSHPSSNNGGVCICGTTLGGWQPLGIFEKAYFFRDNLPSILCESCFRHIFSSPVTSNGTYVELKRCVVPMTIPEPPTSFTSVFYGHGTSEQKLAESLIDLSSFRLPFKNINSEIFSTYRDSYNNMPANNIPVISNASPSIVWQQGQQVMSSQPQPLQLHPVLPVQQVPLPSSSSSLLTLPTQQLASMSITAGPQIPPPSQQQQQQQQQQLHQSFIPSINDNRNSNSNSNVNPALKYPTPSPPNTGSSISINNSSITHNNNHNNNNSTNSSTSSGILNSSHHHHLQVLSHPPPLLPPPPVQHHSSQSVGVVPMSYLQNRAGFPGNHYYNNNNPNSNNNQYNNSADIMRHTYQNNINNANTTGTTMASTASNNYSDHPYTSTSNLSTGGAGPGPVGVGGVQRRNGNGPPPSSSGGIGPSGTNYDNSNSSSSSTAAGSGVDSFAFTNRAVMPTTAIANNNLNNFNVPNGMPMAMTNSTANPMLPDSRLELSRFISMMRVGVDVIKMGRGTLSRQQVRTLFLDGKNERLCWLPPGRSQLIPDFSHSVLLSTIQQIRVGAGRWAKCVNLVFSSRTLILKVEDQRLFKQLVDGLILLTDSFRVDV